METPFYLQCTSLLTLLQRRKTRGERCLGVSKTRGANCSGTAGIRGKDKSRTVIKSTAVISCVWQSSGQMSETTTQTALAISNDRARGLKSTLQLEKQTHPHCLKHQNKDEKVTQATSNTKREVTRGNSRQEERGLKLSYLKCLTSPITLPKISTLSRIISSYSGFSG